MSATHIHDARQAAATADHRTRGSDLSATSPRGDVGPRARDREALLLRIGGTGAVLGTVFQVAAGTGSSSLPGGSVDAALTALAAQPTALWPVIYLGFIFGALFWVATLVALTATLHEGAPWALARLAVAGVIVGVTLHAVDAMLNGFVLPSLAGAWAAAAPDEQAVLAQDADLLRHVLAGSWAVVVTLFHGVPFVLAGLAVALSGRYPAWLGWVGVLGGAGSVVVGVALFFGALSAGLAVPFAIVLSLFMVILGWLMWLQSDRPAAAARDLA
jgi:hypothetical protein